MPCWSRGAVSSALPRAPSGALHRQAAAERAAVLFTSLCMGGDLQRLQSAPVARLRPCLATCHLCREAACCWRDQALPYAGQGQPVHPGAASPPDCKRDEQHSPQGQPCQWLPQQDEQSHQAQRRSRQQWQRLQSPLQRVLGLHTSDWLKLALHPGEQPCMMRTWNTARCTAQ